MGTRTWGTGSSARGRSVVGSAGRACRREHAPQAALQFFGVHALSISSLHSTRCGSRAWCSSASINCLRVMLVSTTPNSTETPACPGGGPGPCTSCGSRCRAFTTWWAYWRACSSGLATVLGTPSGAMTSRSCRPAGWWKASVFHLQHQDAAAGVQDAEVGVALPGAHGNVVPEQVIGVELVSRRSARRRSLVMRATQLPNAGIKVAIPKPPPCAFVCAGASCRKNGAGCQGVVCAGTSFEQNEPVAPSNLA